MTRPRRNNAVARALYLNAAILAAILVVILSRGNQSAMLPQALGQFQPPIAGGAGLFVMPGQFSTNTWGCYLLDVDTQTLCVYQYFPPDKQLRLVAARNFRHDRQLADFNTGSPSPEDVRQMIERSRQTPRTQTNPAVPDVAPE